MKKRRKQGSTYHCAEHQVIIDRNLLDNHGLHEAAEENRRPAHRQEDDEVQKERLGRPVAHHGCLIRSFVDGRCGDRCIVDGDGDGEDGCNGGRK